MITKLYKDEFCISLTKIQTSSFQISFNSNSKCAQQKQRFGDTLTVESCCYNRKDISSHQWMIKPVALNLLRWKCISKEETLFQNSFHGQRKVNGWDFINAKYTIKTEKNGWTSHQLMFQPAALNLLLQNKEYKSSSISSTIFAEEATNWNKPYDSFEILHVNVWWKGWVKLFSWCAWDWGVPVLDIVS